VPSIKARFSQARHLFSAARSCQRTFSAHGAAVNSFCAPFWMAQNLFGVNPPKHGFAVLAHTIRQQVSRQEKGKT
jgi:hypothetical protein